MRLGQIIGAKEVPKDMAHGTATRGPSVWLKSVPSIWRRYCFGGYGRMILPDVHKHPCPQEQRQGTLGISGCDRPAVGRLIFAPHALAMHKTPPRLLRPVVAFAIKGLWDYSPDLSVVSKHTAPSTSAPPNQPAALKHSFQKSHTHSVPSTGSRWQVTAARTRLMRLSPCP